MRKIIYITFLSILFISCAKQPLNVEVSAEDYTIYVHSQGDFSCNASGGSEKYEYNWRMNDIIIDCSGITCEKTFDKIGKYDINCEINDGKKKINQSVVIEVIKIPKNIEYVIALGDSLTAGKGVDASETWVSLYSEELGAELYNHAISGATSYSVSDYQLGLIKEDKILDDKNKIIFLWFGANDIKNFISVEEFKANYVKTIKGVSSIHNSEIILITIPDVSKLSAADQIEQNVNDLLGNIGVQLDVKKIGQDLIASYNQVIIDLAKEYNLNVIDMFSYMTNFDNSLIGADGFHPNEKGHEEISKFVKKEVDGFFEDYRLY